MRRVLLPTASLLCLTLAWVGCSKDQPAATPVNPRLAKSGQALVDESSAVSLVHEPEGETGPSAESSIPGKLSESNPAPAMSQSPQTGQVAAEPLPTEAEILNLIRPVSYTHLTLPTICSV